MAGRAQAHQVDYAVRVLQAFFEAEERRYAGLPPSEEKIFNETSRNLCHFASEYLIACNRSSGLSDMEAGWEERTWGALHAADHKETQTYLGFLQVLVADAESDRIAHLCLVQHFEVLSVTGAPVSWPLAQFISRALRQPLFFPKQRGRPRSPEARNQIIHDAIHDVVQVLKLRPTRNEEADEAIVSACDVVAEAVKHLEGRPYEYETIRRIWYNYRSHGYREAKLNAEAANELEVLLESDGLPEILARLSKGC